MVERLPDYPNLPRVAPAYGRLSGEDRFELGITIILDGLTNRANQ